MPRANRQFPRDPQPALGRLGGLVLACLLFAVDVSAGKLIRVGASRSYTSIQQAINAASSGDLILVDPGSYASFVIDGKSLAILSDLAPFTLIPNNSQAVARIQNIPAGQSVTVMGWNTKVQYGTVSPLVISNCTGSIRIKHATITPTTNLTAAPMTSVALIDNCTSVSFHDVYIVSAQRVQGSTSNGRVVARVGIDRGISAVQATASHIHLARSVLRGYDNFAANSAGAWGGDALRLIGPSAARIDESPTQISGGSARSYGGSAVHLIATNPLEDVTHCGSLFGFDRFVRGTAPYPGGFFAINHDRGEVGNAARRVPGCLRDNVGHIRTNTRMRINQSHNFTITSRFPRQYVGFIGNSAFMRIPGADNTGYLDYFSPLTLVIGFGVLQAPALSVTIPVFVPNVSALVGYQFATQAGLGPVAGTNRFQPSLSMAEIIVITP